MKTFTIVWHRLGHTELEASAATALDALGEVFPSDDDPATPAEILEELGGSSVETPGFSMWVSPADAGAERTVSVLSRIRVHQHEVIKRIRERAAGIKREHKEVPATHHFPDGTRVRYWRDLDDGLVYGQLIGKDGQHIRSKFTYLGDTP